MKYTVEASFVRVLGAPKRLRKHPVLHALWQALFCAPMSLMAYMGAFAGTVLFVLAPSELVAAHAHNPDLYAPVAAINSVGIAAICLYLVFFLYRRLRVFRSVDIDAIVLLLASLLALCLALLQLLVGEVP